MPSTIQHTENGVKYLATPIVASKQTATPRYGMTAMGYSVRSGAPTSYMILLEGEKRWRRVMVLCFSNCGSLFVRVAGQRLFIQNEWDIQEKAIKA